MKNKKYKPLPDSLTIKKSEIEGLGIFATKDIKKNTIFRNEASYN